MNKSMKKTAVALALTAAATLTGCFTDPGGETEEPGSTYFTLGVAVGSPAVNYLLSLDSLLFGSVTPVGNGIEVPGAGMEAIQSGKYLYDFTRSTKNFSQYELKANGTLGAAVNILGTAYVADRAYSKNLVGDSVLLFIDPIAWTKPDMKWLQIRIPEFTVKASGAVTIPTIIQTDTVKWNTNVGRAVVSGNKVYMGTTHYDNSGNVLAGARVVAMDWPSMTNPQLITDTRLNAELGIVARNNSFKTENGDVYFAGSAGTGGYWGKTPANGIYGSVLRIKAGQTQFDASYLLDFTAALGENTNVMSVHYVGDDIAIALLFKDSDLTGFGSAAQDKDIYYYAKVNLATRAVTKYKLPKGGQHLARNPLVQGDKFYSFYKNVAGGTTRVLEIDLGGGDSSFTLGAQVLGTGVTGYGIYGHPTE